LCATLKLSVPCNNIYEDYHHTCVYYCA